MNISRKDFLLIFLFLFCVSVSATRVNCQIEGREREVKLSEESLAASNQRLNRIEKEIGQSRNLEWAGEYQYGDGLGVNVTFTFAPKSGFVFTWFGCLGLYDQNYGNVEWGNGKLKLLFEHPNKREGFQGIAPELVPVLWGKRHYLIPANEIVKFTNAVNGGFEPCSFSCTSFLLKTGDEKRSVSGQPGIPKEYRVYLLKKPIRARVSSVGESRVETDSDDPGLQYRTTKVVLNAGRAKGVLPGMEFHVYDPDRIGESARVTRVEEQFSEAEIVQIQFKDSVRPIPSIDWKFSTTIKDIK